MNMTNLRKLDLNLLVLFEILMEERNVSRAADRAALSQSAMSKALARLREMLHDPILVRSKNGMEPTERARQLRGPIGKALVDLEDSLLAPEPFDPLSSERCFSLLATDYVESLLMPHLLQRLSEEGTHIQLAIKKITPANMISMEDGGLDFFIGKRPKHKNYLENVHLFDDDNCCVVCREHPAIKEGLSLKHFLDFPHLLLSPPEESRDIVDHLLDKQQLKRQVSYISPYITSISSLVRHSTMIATVPARMVKDEVDLGLVKQFAPPFEVPGVSVYLSWHEKKQYDLGHLWLKKVIVEAAAELSSCR